MTGRERMLTAIANQQPDMVPVAPDISNMVPCRLTGKPFWEVYMNDDPPLWKAYHDAMRYYGMDGWNCYGRLDYTFPEPVETEIVETRQEDGRFYRRQVAHTPAGDLFSERVFYEADSPTETEKPVKNLKQDFEALRYLLQEPVAVDDTVYREQRKDMGEDGIITVGIPIPGFHTYGAYFDGGLEAITYAWADHPDLMEELRLLIHRRAVRTCELAVSVKPDAILTGGSGAITMSSPDLFRDISLPTLKEVCRIARQAGVPSMVHCCGKERALVKMAAEETELDCINPLEVPPMGDCDLAEIKRSFGDRLALMGNLHTTEIMLRGTTAEVEAACRKAIDDAAEGGGFILSTGDQCGRDTPDENLFAMVRTAREYGRYP